MTPDSKWCIVLPPYGAARTVALNAANALKAAVGSSSFKCFDTLIYSNAFTKLLREPDDDTVTDLLNESLTVSCLDFEVTHLLTCALSPVTLFTYNLLRRQGICTIHWFYEDYKRASYWKDIIGGIDHFCAIQKGPLPELCMAAGSRYHFLSTAVSEIHNDTGLHNYDITHDIAFIGIPSQYRIQILEKLKNDGFSLTIAGSGWDKYAGILESSIVCNSWTDSSLSFDILSKSVIGINLSVENPSAREDVHISPRVYDILSSNALLLTEDVPLLQDSLPGFHFSTFRGVNDISEEVNKILLKSQEIRKMEVMKNKSLIQMKHTYKNRIEQLLSFVSR